MNETTRDNTIDLMNNVTRLQNILELYQHVNYRLSTEHNQKIADLMIEEDTKTWSGASWKYIEEWQNKRK